MEGREHFTVARYESQKSCEKPHGGDGRKETWQENMNDETTDGTDSRGGETGKGLDDEVRTAEETRKWLAEQ